MAMSENHILLIDPEIKKKWQKVAKILMAYGTPTHLEGFEFQLNSCPEAMAWLANSDMVYRIFTYHQPDSYTIVFENKKDAAQFKLMWC